MLKSIITYCVLNQVEDSKVPDCEGLGNEHGASAPY